MGKIIDEPKFPIVDKHPKFWGVVGNFSLKDYGSWALVAATGVPVGYMAGKRKSPAYSTVSGTILRSSLATGVAIGAFAGFLYAYQSSAGRLMGFFPNEKEVSTAAARQ